MVYIFRHEFAVDILTDIRPLFVPVKGHNDDGGVVLEHDVTLLLGALLIQHIHLNKIRQCHAVCVWAGTYVMT